MSTALFSKTESSIYQTPKCSPLSLLMRRRALCSMLTRARGICTVPMRCMYSSTLDCHTDVISQAQSVAVRRGTSVGSIASSLAIQAPARSGLPTEIPVPSLGARARTRGRGSIPRPQLDGCCSPDWRDSALPICPCAVIHHHSRSRSPLKRTHSHLFRKRPTLAVSSSSIALNLLKLDQRPQHLLRNPQRLVHRDLRQRQARARRVVQVARLAGAR